MIAARRSRHHTGADGDRLYSRLSVVVSSAIGRQADLAAKSMVTTAVMLSTENS